MEPDILNDEIHGLILRHFPRAARPLRSDMRFENDLGGDSMNFVELIMESEIAFQISISDTQAASMHTVGDLETFIRETRIAHRLNSP